MKHIKLRRLIFLALCCDLGLFTKRLIAPAANLLTDSLHIPGGISTSFSLMFLVIAAVLTPSFGCGTLMGAVQSLIALSLGMVGSMGALSPVGYIVPGFVIDCVVLFSRKARLGDEMTMLAAGMLSAASAVLVANVIVFHLKGLVLLLYLATALTSGALCGVLGGSLVRRLRPVLCGGNRKEENHETEKTDHRHPCSPHSADGSFGAAAFSDPRPDSGRGPAGELPGQDRSC